MKLTNITRNFTKEQLDYMKNYDNSITMTVYDAPKKHRVIYSFNNSRKHLSVSQADGHICTDTVNTLIDDFFGEDTENIKAFMSQSGVLHLHLELSAGVFH